MTGTVPGMKPRYKHPGLKPRATNKGTPNGVLLWFVNDANNDRDGSGDETALQTPGVETPRYKQGDS
ncbi:hypothetical protein CLV42_114186 [Chitinophaga ginsengisoli]|uniref:Uncharacterized protein n=1 Tax=Chitinophaga ginsengisoli TaxID=363837 RepID=A0A2P8FTI2_9BACT|nr:hypothetical protein CLV42_114186 [Chitinophaga ginsengisoli]